MKATQRKLIFALAGVFILVCWMVVQQTHLLPLHRRGGQDQTWQARVALTTDNPIAARQVILDSVYAGKTIVVAQAYEKALGEKPWRTNRIITFAHAAEETNKYSGVELKREGNGSNEKFNEVIGLLDHARKELRTLIKPPNASDAHTEIADQDRRSFQPTQSADAWLAWSNFSGDPESYPACQKAIQLDPAFGEAYYDLGSKYSFSRSAQMKRPTKAAALQYFDRAEQLEPKLHTLVLFQRYLIAKEDGNNRGAAGYLREYLRLWPNAFHAQEARQELAQLEASQQQKHGT